MEDDLKRHLDSFSLDNFSFPLYSNRVKQITKMKIVTYFLILKAEDHPRFTRRKICR